MGTGTELAKYGSYELDAAQGEAEELEKSGGGAFMKLEAGRNVVRFMPPKLGKKSPFVMVHQHFFKLPGMEKGLPINCPRMMARQSCPVCNMVDKLRNSGNQADYKAAGELFAKLRVFANVINRKAPELGPQVVAFGKTVHEQLVKMRTDEDAGGDFTHPEDGFDIIIERTGQGFDTKYFVKAARTVSSLGDYEWIEAQHDLDMLAKVKSAEDIKAEIAEAAPQFSGGGGPAPARPQRPAPGGGGARKPAARSAQDDMTTVDDED